MCQQAVKHSLSSRKQGLMRGRCRQQWGCWTPSAACLTCSPQDQITSACCWSALEGLEQTMPPTLHAMHVMLMLAAALRNTMQACQLVNALQAAG